MLAERAYVFGLSGEGRALFGLPKDVGDTIDSTHFAAFRKSMQYPRELGHVGLCHCHHVWDRLLKSACKRHHLQYTFLVEDIHAAEMSDADAMRQWCVAFFIAVGCFLHDVHNGFTKGIDTYITDVETMRATWICLESVRNACRFLTQFLGEWVSERLVFEAWDFPRKEELWLLLGFSDRWVTLLADMEVRFLDGKLRVSPRYEHNEELPQLLTTVMLKAWFFKR